MIGAAVVGSWFGAGFVSGAPRRKIQIGMGLALLGAALLMFLMKIYDVPPAAATRWADGLEARQAGRGGTSCSARS